MSVKTIRPQWRTTCDLCGYEAVQEINELPEDWFAVVKGGEQSQIKVTSVQYSVGNNVFLTHDIAVAAGECALTVCPDCQQRMLFEYAKHYNNKDYRGLLTPWFVFNACGGTEEED